jgi:hypothetical protein
MPAHREPPWEPSLSDGCSVPKALRFWAPIEGPADLAVCLEHDRAYYYGGTEREKAIADAELLLGHLRNGHMSVAECHRRHTAVRMAGKSHWGEYGVFTDEPAVPLPGPIEAP